MSQDASAAAYTLAAIVARLGGELRGDAAVPIEQVGTLKDAGPGQIAFLANPRYRRHLQATRASAVILAPELADDLPTSTPDGAPLAAILTPHPYVYYARLAALLNPPRRPPPGIHPTAVVESDVPASCHVGPGVHVAAGVRLGENVTLHAHVVLGENVEIGADGILHAGVVVYHDCRIGARAIIHAGAVIGADGFGFAPDAGTWLKIPQIGKVLIGDDVEIGANTSIDRGALEDTRIGDGCKLDNQIQVAHNCVIGPHTVIAGCVGIAGSTRIGAHCAIGGAAMILGHLEIADGCEISPGTMVMKSITRPGKYTALYPLDSHDNWLHNAAHLKHLGALNARLVALERKLATKN
jgi:UDP-3-O-[3-hydroxymyristoyl] glucosamine N-acyltransferase